VADTALTFDSLLRQHRHLTVDIEASGLIVVFPKRSDCNRMQASRLEYSLRSPLYRVTVREKKRG